MKLILSSMITLFSFSVFAANHVGDTIELHVFSQGTKVAEVEQKIIERDARGERHLSTQQIRYSNGTVENSTAWLGDDEIWTHDNAAVLLGNCDSLGGELSSIRDLARRSHTTCKMPINNKNVQAFLKDFGFDGLNDGFVWVGDFPVNGLAQIEVSGLVYRLSSYRWME